MKFTAICLVTLACVAYVSAARIHPVILMPGLSASWMDARLNRTETKHFWCTKKSDWYNIWLSPAQLLPSVIECFKDNFKLIVDPVTGLTTNTPGVETRVPYWGETESVERIMKDLKLSVVDYFGPIVNRLVEKGYQRGVSVRGAPYDFRKAPYEHEEYFKNLTLLIEETYTMNKDTKVVVVGHSMGTMFFYYLMRQKSQEWKDKYIRSWVPVAGPLGGAGETLVALLQGSNLHIPIYNNVYLRDLQRTCPSLLFALPNPLVWENRTILTLNGTEYTAHDLDEILEMVGDKGLIAMYKKTKGLLGDLSHPGVSVSCVVGKGSPTPIGMKYDMDDTFPDAGTVVWGKGDKTVNTFSGNVCLRWQDNPNHKFEYKTFNHPHLSIMKQPDLVNHVTNHIFVANQEL